MEGVGPIGGYFELELAAGDEYHKAGLRFNLGRSCLEFLLREIQPRVLYLPLYTCSAVLEPVRKLGLAYKFYSITEKFEMDIPNSILSDNTKILYTNYFGLKGDYIRNILSRYPNRLIIDNSQAFFNVLPAGSDVFYSCRKFFGVPDGAYLYTSMNAASYSRLDLDISIQRMDYLLRRLELGAKAGYESFRKIENSFEDAEVRKMSKLTERLMRSIRYAAINDARRLNYVRLHELLGPLNMLKLPTDVAEGPLAYPFMSGRPGLRKYLIENDIFVPRYWDNVLQNTTCDKWEHRLAVQLCPLPVDQRLTHEDVERIACVTKDFVNGK